MKRAGIAWLFPVLFCFAYQLVFILLYIFVNEFTTQLRTQRNGPATNATTTTQSGGNGASPTLSARMKEENESTNRQSPKKRGDNHAKRMERS